jgi:hypothetical protein
MQSQWAGTSFYSVDALVPYVGAERQAGSTPRAPWSGPA